MDYKKEYTLEDLEIDYDGLVALGNGDYYYDENWNIRLEQ